MKFRVTKYILLAPILLLLWFYVYLSSNTCICEFDHVYNVAHSAIASPSYSTPIEGGGLHGCARFSTSYEARHIVTWLYYHKRIGFSHFHLYFDSLHSNLSNPLEGKAYSMISALPYVTIYDQFLFQFNQGKALTHCITLSHIQLKAEWVMDFDIDEVFSFNQRLGGIPSCNEGEYEAPVGALATFTSNIPSNINAVIFPRIQFRSNGFDNPSESLNQMELYVHREQYISHEGKFMIRTNVSGSSLVKISSKHGIWSSVGGSTMYPCGESVTPTKCDDAGYCNYVFNQTALSQERHLNAPFLYHYVTRSTHECLLKLKNLPDVNWRVKNSHSVCNDEVSKEMIFDYGVYCSGKATRRDLIVRYGSYHQPPYIF